MKTKSILLTIALSLTLVGCGGGGGGGDTKPQDCSTNSIVETTDNGSVVNYKVVNNLCNSVSSYSLVNNVLSSITYSEADFIKVIDYPSTEVRKVTRYNPANGAKMLEINYEFWNNYIEVVTYLEDGGISFNSYTANQPEFTTYLLDTSAIVAVADIDNATKNATFN